MCLSLSLTAVLFALSSCGGSSPARSTVPAASAKLADPPHTGAEWAAAYAVYRGEFRRAWAKQCAGEPVGPEQQEPTSHAICHVPAFTRTEFEYEVRHGLPTYALLPTAAPRRGPCTELGGHPRSADPATRHTLVPAGASSLVICEYIGLEDGISADGRLSSEQRVTGPRVRQFTALLDAQRPLRDEVKPESCPEDSGRRLALLFYYTNSNVDPVTVTGGCASISNGHVQRIDGLPQREPFEWPLG
jgi:hypothetical protein